MKQVSLDSAALAQDAALMTLKQLAAYLQVDPQTVSCLAREGKIPCHKIGSRQFRFHRSAVLNALLLYPAALSTPEELISEPIEGQPINTPSISRRRRLGPGRSRPSA